MFLTIRRASAPHPRALLVALAFVLLPLGVAHAQTPPAGSTAPSTWKFATPPGVRKEIPSLRTQSSRTYMLDNQLVTDLFQGSVNYWAGSAWQPIDDSLVPVTDPSLIAAGYAYQNRANRFTVLFPSNLSAAPIKVEFQSSWIGFSLDGGTGTASVSGNTISYPLAGGSLSYAVDGDTVKESITLAGPTSPSSYTFILRTSSDLRAETGVDRLLRVLDGRGKTLFSLIPPSMADSSRTTAGRPTPVSMASSARGSGLSLTLAADRQWLADPHRVYPVVIDPTVDVGYFSGGVQDCMITSGQGATAYCSPGWATMQTGDGESASPFRTLYQFAVQGIIPSSATVLKAALELRTAGYNTCCGSASGSVTLAAYQMTRSWTTAATWTTYDGSNAWTIAGADFASSPVSTTVVPQPTGPNQTGIPYFWDLTSLVQTWLRTPSSNDGVLLKEPSEDTGLEVYFAGSSSNNQYNGPVLEVTYTASSPGVVPWNTYYGWSLDDQSDISVNVANGNLVVDDHVFSLPGIGLDLTQECFYSEQSQLGLEYGSGWGCTLGADAQAGEDPDGVVDYFDASGNTWDFVPNGNGGYSSPPGMDPDLTANDDGSYTFTYHDNQERLHFSVNNNSLLTDTDRSGNTLTYNYNCTCALASVTDTQGRATTLSYGSDGVSQITDPAGRVYQYAYSADSQGGFLLVQYTDPAGEITRYGYDSLSQMSSITDPRGNVTTIAYNSSDQVTSITADNYPTQGANATTTFTYETVNGVPTTVVTDPDGHSVQYATDGLGRVTAFTDQSGNITQYAWTTDNHLAAILKPNGGQWSYYYDSLNNLYAEILPGATSSSTGPAFEWSYNEQGPFPYQPTGYLDDNSNQWSYGYNGQGLLNSVTDPLGHSSSAVYNGNGTVASETDANGHTTSYTYYGSGTDVGLLDQAIPPGPLGTETYQYDSANRVSSFTDGKGQASTYSYDYEDRLASTGEPDGTGIGYVYDGDGNLTAMQDITGRTTWTYNAGNDETSKQLPNGQTVSYTYDPAGDMLSKTDAGGTVASYAYYYDAVGNMLGETINGATTNMAYNAADELTSANNTGYTYDGNGNQMTGRASFGYNAQDQTTSITPNGGSSVGMRYTGAGQAERVGAGGSSFQYDDTGMDSMTTGDGTTYFTTGPDGQLISERVPNGYGQHNTYWYLFDGQGSVAGIANSAGGLENEYYYDPYGNPTGGFQLDSNPFQYLGAVWDPSTGLYQMGDRYYDPSIGRFTQQDPLGGGYIYAADDPVNNSDPSGSSLRTGYGGGGGEDIGPVGPDEGGGAAAGEVEGVGDDPASDVRPRRSRYISRATKRAVDARNPANTCRYCGRRGYAKEYDHRTAYAKGGSNGPENVDKTCRWCNRSKGAGPAPKAPPPHPNVPWAPGLVIGAVSIRRPKWKRTISQG